MQDEQSGSAEDQSAKALQDFDQLLNEVRHQLPKELGPLLEQFRPYLLTIAMGEFPEALRGKFGASDLVQDTILRGLENFGDFRGATREELAGWLRQILLHQMINTVSAFATLKRDVAREVPTDSRMVHPGQSSPSGQMLTKEEWETLQNALARLPEDYRQAVLLRHRENLSFADIGRSLHRSEEAARKLWSRAIRQLQHELGGHESRS